LSIEIHAPKQLVLLSHYGAWNDIIDEVILAGDKAKMDPIGSRWDRVFQVRLDHREPWREENTHDIQACLPYVDSDWVRSVKQYTLPMYDGGSG
jgi:hypothetical protein